ncbi:MAG: zinc ribbon domain-containing protein [Spirochaetes bacterium]|nr:zinc ribbon domain-containing protein [Spirochaetota bacterium]MBP8987083.1 zinc ribbon domain-containing protein [Spirochaetota bacterium]
MPIYEFKCNNCNHIYSELRKMGDSTPSPCPQCQSHNTEKIISLISASSHKQSCSACSSKNCSHCK